MRLAPIFIILIVLAGLAWFLWPDPATTSVDGAPAGTEGAAAAPAAGTLSGDDAAGLTREAAAGGLLVRVLDAQGKACAATVQGKVNGAAKRLSTADGMLRLPPPLENCELIAEAGGAWSEVGTWQAASESPRELVLRLEDVTGASLRIRVQVENEGPAAAPVARITASGRRGGLGELFEDFEFREDLRDREAEQDEAAPVVTVEAPENARARLLRENLAAESWQGRDGVIEIGRLLPGAWSFLITQEGCAPEFLDTPILAGSNEKEVRLQRAGSVVGRVLGANGAPVVGASIGLWSKPESELPWLDPLDDFESYGRLPGSIPGHHRATSDGEGRFTMPLVRPGTYTLLAVTPELRPAVGSLFDVVSLQRADAGDIKLRLGHALKVRVVDPAGQPVAGAVATWRAGESTMAMLSAGAKPALTSATGEVTLNALPGGEVKVEVTAPGYAHARESFDFKDPPREAQNWEVILRAGAILPGLVTSAGMPVAEATVSVVAAEDDAPIIQQLLAAEATTRTAPDGSFRFENLPVGNWRVQVEHDDHSTTRTDELTLLEGENPAIHVQLAPGATLRVTVLDESGAPVPQANIMAMEASIQANENGTTGPDGVAVLDHLRPGTWQVMRLNLGGQEEGEIPADFQVRFEFVELAEGELKDITLGGAVESATIEGRLTVGGEPQSGRMVLLIGNGAVKTATSDADGQYRVEKVEVGEYLVSVMMGLGGGSTWTGSLDVPEGGVQRHDVALPSSAVEVLVLDGASGDPLQGIPVNFRPEDSSNISGGMFVTTDGKGLARFEMLLPGSYLASVGNLAMPLLGGEGRGSAMRGGIHVASADAGTQRVEVRLPEPAELLLRVSGPDGAYLPGVHVFCLDAQGQALNIVSLNPSNSKGVVKLTGLPPGLGHFVARHPEVGKVEFEVMLQAGQQVKQEVTLGTGVHLLLTIVNAKNEPIGGVMPILLDARGHAVNYMFSMEESQAYQQAFYSGSVLRIGPLTPGSYRVQLNRPGSVTVTHSVTLAPAPAEQALRLRFAPE